MGRQRDNPQLKGKEEFLERMINEAEANNWSEIDFKVVVIRILK